MPDLDDLIAFLDGSPSPFHAADSAAQRLLADGFEPLRLSEPWTDVPDQGFVVRGASLIAWRRPGEASAAAPLRVVGAHTDSPCLRIKPRPDTGLLGWRQLGVEVYGGALLNSWLDRDLGIAGRVVLDDGSTVDVCVDEPICRVAQLAIHLDRDVNERGLVLDKQVHLTPIWGTGGTQHGEFARWLAEQIDVDEDRTAAWELSLFDRTPAAVLGADGSLLASAPDRQPGVLLGGDRRPRRLATLRGHGRDRPVRPRGGRLGVHDRRGRAAPRTGARAPGHRRRPRPRRPPRAARRVVVRLGRRGARRAPELRRNATSPTIDRWSTTARRSS